MAMNERVRRLLAVVFGSLPHETKRYWTAVPLSALAPLLAAAACQFAMLGPLLDVMDAGTRTPLQLLATTGVAGALGAAMAWAWLRQRFGTLAGIALIFVAAMALLPGIRAKGVVAPTPVAIRSRLQLDGGLGIAAIQMSYALFLTFVMLRIEPYLALRTEVNLARDIHRLLVPSVERRIGGYEFVGLSEASGEVGGDLVDLVQTSEGRGWVAYVADVSGHGVGAGLVMGMTKAAFRARLDLSHHGEPEPPGSLMRGVSDVLHDLKKPNMFVTVAIVSCSGHGGDVEIALAGHLPILHCRAHDGSVQEVHVAQLPLGIFREQRFEQRHLALERGDTLCLLTDGLTEVFDRNNRQLGLAGVKAVIASHTREPLPSMAGTLLQAARAYGPQADDQSLLFVRRHD
jgi:serine phosphatase RsbU (regulator of sigma subunit)